MLFDFDFGLVHWRIARDTGGGHRAGGRCYRRRLHGRRPRFIGRRHRHRRASLMVFADTFYDTTRASATAFCRQRRFLLLLLRRTGLVGGRVLGTVARRHGRQLWHRRRVTVVPATDVRRETTGAGVVDRRVRGLRIAGTTTRGQGERITAGRGRGERVAAGRGRGKWVATGRGRGERAVAGRRHGERVAPAADDFRTTTVVTRRRRRGTDTAQLPADRPLLGRRRRLHSRSMRLVLVLLRVHWRRLL